MKIIKVFPSESLKWYYSAVAGSPRFITHTSSRKALRLLTHLHSGQVSILTFLTALLWCLLLTHGSVGISDAILPWFSSFPGIFLLLLIFNTDSLWSPYSEEQVSRESLLSPHGFLYTFTFSCPHPLIAPVFAHLPPRPINCRLYLSWREHLSNENLKVYRPQNKFQTSTIQTSCSAQSCRLPCSSALGG